MVSPSNHMSEVERSKAEYHTTRLRFAGQSPRTSWGGVHIYPGEAWGKARVGNNVWEGHVNLLADGPAPTSSPLVF